MTINKPAPKSTFSRVLAGTVVAIAFASGVIGWMFTPPPKTDFIEGRPLLAPGDQPFSDPQIGLKFTPPKGWSMQARSTDAPDQHKPDRMVVKYKRLAKGTKEAWLRVSVSDAPPSAPLSELLHARKRGPNWKVAKEVENDLKVGGKPAARITFAGEMEPDGGKPRECVSEVIGIRRGNQVIFLAATFAKDDEETGKEIHQSIDTVVVN